MEKMYYFLCVCFWPTTDSMKTQSKFLNPSPKRGILNRVSMYHKPTKHTSHFSISKLQICSLEKTKERRNTGGQKGLEQR